MPDIIDRCAAIAGRCAGVFPGADMKADRHARVLNGGPEGIVQWQVVRLFLHLHRQKDCAIAHPCDPLNFFDRGLDIFRGKSSNWSTAVFLGTKKIERPIVLDFAHRGLVSRIRRGPHEETAIWINDFGVDAIAVKIT
jgi:hypothetical protein